MSVKNLVLPFKKLTDFERNLSIITLIAFLALFWFTSKAEYIPTPLEIARSFPRLFEKDIVGSFIKSLGFCFKCMFNAAIISIVVTYLSVLPIFRVVAEFTRKFRFLPSTGLSFLFMKVTHNISEQQSWMMTWGITTWLVYGMIGVALSITDKDIMYAKSIKLNRWQMMRELLIKGKAADLFMVIVGNFAISWMLLSYIENISKVNGGIGVILAESNKYFKFDEVYAIQILILITGILVDWSLRLLKDFLFPYSKY